MKFLQAGILVTFLYALPVSSADSTAEYEAEILLNTIGMEKAIDRSMSQMVDIQIKQNPALLPYKPVMMEFFRKHMNWQSLKPEILQVYVDTFNARELREINSFYATETGKKTIREMPTLMARGAQIGVARIQANRGELEAMIRAETERLQQLEE